MAKLRMFPIAFVLFFPQLAGAFSDVASDHNNAEAITYMQEQDVVQGYADNTFRPGNTVNRAEFTKIIMESVKGKQSDGSCFTDVADEWFAPYICAAKEAGIIGGYPDGSFKPGNQITFAEGAKIIALATKQTLPDVTEPWFAPFILSLSEAHAIPQDVASLSQPLTRGQMSEMMFRILAQKKDKAFRLATDFGIEGKVISNMTSSATTSFSSSSTTTSFPYKFEVSEEWQQRWDSLRDPTTGEIENHIKVEEEMNGKFSRFYRINFPAGSGNRYLTANYGKPYGGVSTFVEPNFAPQSELHLSYYVRIPEGFDFSNGGSLPGLSTGIANDFGEQSSGQVTFTWDKTGRLGVEGAYTTKERAPMPMWTWASLEADNEWHRIDLHVRLQTMPGKYTGFMEASYDGEKIPLSSNAIFLNRQNDLWDSMLFVVEYGGRSADSVAPKDMHIDIAGIVFSNKPIR